MIKFLTPNFKSSSTPGLNRCAADVTTEHFRSFFFNLLPFLFTSTDDVDHADVDSIGTTNGISKFVLAFDPLNRLAAASYARAASSAVSNVPSQCRHRPIRSRISADHLPHGRFRTPRLLLCPVVGAVADVEDEDLVGVGRLSPKRT